MDKPLKILIVEDVATDAELICMELEDSSVLFTSDRVETKEAFVQYLRKSPPDIILSDYSLPSFNALEALTLKNEIDKNIPFILVTGNQTEEIAVACIKKGADDYILKSSLTRLSSALINAIQKKKAELTSILAIEEIKAREEKYRNLFENSLVGMFRASATDCFFIEVNEKAKEILGVNEIEGVHIDDFFLCNESGKLSEQVNAGKTSIENFELQVTKPDNSTTWVSVSARLFEKEGIIEGVIHDITQSKNSYIELERVNYELDRFTYHASHDLRSPLRSFEALIQAAMEEDSIEEIKTCLKMMQRSTGKMDHLINDLLSLAYSKKTEAKITYIEFNQELQDSLSQISFLDNSKHIQINKNVVQHSSFFTDGARLRIILNNLISNAVKYHKLDQANPSIFISIIADEDKAIITVQDNGKGISEKHQSRIFDMFYRADSASEGSGLGLYLVKSTVEKLAGTISLHSEVDKGTTFIIEIPNQTIMPRTEEVIKSELLKNL